MKIRNLLRINWGEVMKKYICHVCGYDGLDEEPYKENEKIPSHDICDCCGCEFGYDDNEQYRLKWIESGGKWFNPKLKPEAWNLERQLKNVM